MHAQRLEGILTARGMESAHRRKGRADEPTIAHDGDHKHPSSRADLRGCPPGTRFLATHCRPCGSCAGPWTMRCVSACSRSNRRSAGSRSAASSACLAAAAAGCARTTTMQPPGRLARRVLISSRRRRFTRLRTTAGPTARLTTKPTFAGSPPGITTKWALSFRPPALRPVRVTSRNSCGRLIRDCRGSTPPPAQPGCPALGGQPRAPLAAARGENRPAGAGTHPEPEAMGLRPPAVVRLERTLAHWSSRE